MNLNFILGTAAELIKVYPLIRLGLERGDHVRVVMTGQSRENFLMQYRDFGLPENILVSLLDKSADLEKASSALRWFVRFGAMSSRRFRAKLVTGPQSYAIVHGDTLSTLLGSWQAWRAGMPIVHVEAGLRSPRLFNPFPEEINRRLVSRLARIHMAPDAKAEDNLRRAGVSGRIVNTQGNTQLDAVAMGLKKTDIVPGRAYALANLHRFENLNSPERWKTMIETVLLAAKHLHVIFVAHPQTKHKLDTDPSARLRLNEAGVEIRERMPFSSFVTLLKGADYLISDGGSNQEECSYLGKPCLLLRESTERSEGLDGCCVLSRFDMTKIESFLQNPSAFQRPAVAADQSPSRAILLALQDSP